MYTDGVSESRNAAGKEFGERSIKKILAKSHGKSIQKIRDEIASQVKTHMGESEQLDDITFLLLSWKKSLETQVAKAHTETEGKNSQEVA